MKGKGGISNLLVEICKQRRNLSNALLADAGVHGGQDILLYQLSTRDGQTISELVEKMCIQYATLSTMATRMEAKGLVKREKDGADQRVSRLFLTEMGREAFHEVASVWRQMERRLSRDLSEAEQQTLKRLLEKVLKSL
jgi:DNA-binding MarR family transcriptional regulator